MVWFFLMNFCLLQEEIMEVQKDQVHAPFTFTVVVVALAFHPLTHGTCSKTRLDKKVCTLKGKKGHEFARIFKRVDSIGCSLFIITPTVSFLSFDLKN